MNMISTGAFLTEMDASDKQETLAEKFAAVWEKKNSKAARAGGVSLMALSLAACGSSSDDTAAVETPVVEEPVVEEPTTPVAPTPTVNTITKALLDFASGDTLAGTDGDDVLNVEINSNLANTTTISGIETINVTSFGATSIDFTKITDVATLGSADSTGAITLNNVNDATMGLSFSGSGTNSITANYKAGALNGTADNLAISASGATGIVVDADAGFESFSIATAADATAAIAASTVTTVTIPGATTATLTVGSGLTMGDGTLTNVTTTTASGAGALKLGTMTGVKTIDASDMTGAVTVAATVASTGLANDSITGVAAGSTIQTGAGDDHIDFVSGANAAKVNTIKTGAGDDTVEVTIGNGYLSLLTEAGDDTVHTGSTDSNDYINGGTGDDTVNLTGSNSATMRGVENVVIAVSGDLDATNSTEALNVTAKTDSAAAVTDVSVTNLASGSTVTIVDSTAALTAGADQVTVGYKTTEASATVDVNTKVTASAGSDDFTVTKVSDLTIDFAKAVDLGGNTAALEIDDTTSVTITAAADVDLGEIAAAATDALTSVTATSSKKMDTGDIVNDAALVTVSVTGGTSANVGAIATASKLTDVTVTGTTTTAALGAVGGTTVSTAINDITVTGGTTATVGAIKAKAMTSHSVTATKGKLDHDGITIANSSAGSLGDVTLTATEGELEAEAIDSDLTMGTITLTSTAGAIDLEDGSSDAAVSAADTSGITVAMTAKTFISDDGTDVNGYALIENTKGDITASIAGAAAANVRYDAGSETEASTGTVNLTATNTGGLTTTIINGAVTKDGSSSTISVGDAATGKTNAVTLDGISDTITVNGGSGKDTVDFASGNTYLNGTFALGGGSADAIDFTNLDATGANATAYNGLVINLSSAAVTFDSGTATETSVSAGSVKGYDDDAASTKSNVDSTGGSFTVTGVEVVTGTANADYIAAANTGMTITGGGGADTIALGAGADTIIMSASGSNGSDTITGFTVNSDSITMTAMTAGTGAEATEITAAGAAVTTTNRADFVQVINTDGTAASVTTLGTATLAAADFTAATLTNVAAFIAEKFSGNSSTTDADTGVYVINYTGGSNDTTYVYQFDNDTSANVTQAAELALVATITRDAVLDNGDIVA